jgi:SAM-dependent methyltransferase
MAGWWRLKRESDSVLGREYRKIFAEEERYWWYVGRRSILKRILSRSLPGRARVAVDVGCGTGMNFTVLQEYADTLSGVDTSPVAVAYCRQRGFSQVRQLERVGDPLPYDSASVDLVTLFDTLEHAADDHFLLREAHRILKPKGLVILTVPAYPFLWSEHDMALKHYRRYRRAPLVGELRRHGFRVRKASYCITAFFPVIVLYRVGKGIFNTLQPKAPHTSHVRLPSWLNHLFGRVLAAEGWLLQYGNLPYGTSIVVVAEKVSTA